MKMLFHTLQVNTCRVSQLRVLDIALNPEPSTQQTGTLPPGLLQRGVSEGPTRTQYGTFHTEDWHLLPRNVNEEPTKTVFRTFFRANWHLNTKSVT